MGCDIHEHYEIWSGAAWTHVLIWPSLDWENLTQEEEDAAFETVGNHPAILWRNYALFSVLANVRNTFGIIPISLPKGIPLDLSDSVKHKFENYVEPWEHDASWLSLKELLDFDWNRIIDEYRGNEFVTYRDAVDPFTTKTLPYLNSLVDDPAKLRIIFWFDN